MNAFQKFQQGQGGPAAQPPAAAQGPAGRPFGPRPAPARPAAAAPPQRRRAASKYAGLRSGGDRAALLPLGTHLVKWLHGEESNIVGKDPYFSTQLECAWSDNAEFTPGSVGGTTQCVSTKAISAGGPRVKAQIMAFAGFETDADYDAFDPEGEFIQACGGESGMCYPNGDAIPANPLEGSYAWVQVSRGKNTADGTDFFRNLQWSVATPEDVAQATGAQG